MRSDPALANALRQVNAAYYRLPRDTQESMHVGYDDFDREVDAAIVSGERKHISVAIKEFKSHWLTEIARAR